jgi:hypothetical protein
VLGTAGEGWFCCDGRSLRLSGDSAGQIVGTRPAGPRRLSAERVLEMVILEATLVQIVKIAVETRNVVIGSASLSGQN